MSSDNTVHYIRLGKHKLVEYDVAKEQCSALGRAGRELQHRLQRYHADQQQHFVKQSAQTHYQQLTEATMALMMTREYLGFRHANLDWITKQFVLPSQVIERLTIPVPQGYLGRSGH